MPTVTFASTATVGALLVAAEGAVGCTLHTPVKIDPTQSLLLVHWKHAMLDVVGEGDGRLGCELGWQEGLLEGREMGCLVGCAEGCDVGRVGSDVGCLVGWTLGCLEG